MPIPFDAATIATRLAWRKCEARRFIECAEEPTSHAYCQNWAYDALDRLTDETLTVQSGGSNAPSPYHDHFVLDAAGNRVEEDADTNNDGTYDQKVLDTYNKDDQLTLEETDNYVNSTNPVTSNPSLQYKNSYGYNNDGFETSRTVSRPDGSGESDTYTPDLRGRMQEAQSTVTSSGGQQTPSTSIYGYDTDGVRVSETTNSTSTYFLNDPNNPTGYAKAVQEMASPGGTPARSYLIGLTGVEAQQGRAVGVSSGPTDALVLLHDGHGSTRALVDVSTGSVQEQYDYSAFGDLLAADANQSSAAAALTPWLFAGDGLYDSGSGWTYNLARWRDGFRFTSMDPTVFGPEQVANANLELYVGGNPVNLTDPTGHDLTGLLTAMGVGATIGAITGGAIGFTYATVYQHLPILSLTTLKDTVIGAIGGGIIGALIGGGGYIAATAGTEGGIALLRSGVAQLLTKLAFPHSTTAGFAIAGFGVGLVTGLVAPDPRAIAAGAASVIATGGADVVTRGLMRNRDLLIKVFGPSAYMAARAILFNYVQASTFYSIGFAVGFTAGYTVGYEIRVHVIDRN